MIQKRGADCEIGSLLPREFEARCIQMAEKEGLSQADLEAKVGDLSKYIEAALADANAKEKGARTATEAALLSTAPFSTAFARSLQSPAIFSHASLSGGLFVRSAFRRHS